MLPAPKVKEISEEGIDGKNFDQNHLHGPIAQALGIKKADVTPTNSDSLLQNEDPFKEVKQVLGGTKVGTMSNTSKEGTGSFQNFRDRLGKLALKARGVVRKSQ